jgi:hypothetical protein
MLDEALRPRMVHRSSLEQERRREPTRSICGIETARVILPAMRVGPPPVRVRKNNWHRWIAQKRSWRGEGGVAHRAGRLAALTISAT